VERVSSGFAESVSGLIRRNGRLLLERPGQEPVEVTIRYLRPLTERTELVLLDDKGREVASVAGEDAFPEGERELVREALRLRYHLPVIRRVERVEVRFGTRYWWVDTDRGPRWFALREPGKNVTWLSPSHVVLRDTAGNRYEVQDVGALDPSSQRRIRMSL